MKSLLSLAVLIAANTSFAGNATPLVTGDLSLTSARARIVDVSSICPRVPGQMSCMAFGSTVKVEVTMNGCVDRMGGFFSSFEEVNGKGVLNFGAINVNTHDSIRTRCYRAQTETVSVYVGYEGPIELKELSFSPMTKTRN